MSEESRNEMAVIEINSAIGSASYLTKFLTDRDDARQIAAAFTFLAHKVSKEHGLPLPAKTDSSNRALKS